jgi:hypothetical protein
MIYNFKIKEVIEVYNISSNLEQGKQGSKVYLLIISEGNENKLINLSLKYTKLINNYILISGDLKLYSQG